MNHAPVTSEILDRLPPSNLDAELGVIGSMLLSDESWDDVLAIIEPADFYDDANRVIFARFAAMKNSGIPLHDLTLLVEELRTHGEFETIGGCPYLAKAGLAVANAAHAIWYAMIVKRMSGHRRMIDVGTEILRSGYEPGDADVGETVSRFSETLAEIASGAVSSRPNVVAEIAANALEEIDQVQRGERSMGVATGLHALDSILGTLRPGELTILAARPSMGKSALAAQLADCVASRAWKPTVFISLEMRAENIALRMLCSRAEVNTRHATNGDLCSQERDDLIEAAASMGDPPLHFVDDPVQTVASIIGECRRIEKNGSLGLVVIDYLGRIEMSEDRVPRQEQVARTVGKLKTLAVNLACPVLVLCQLNRSNESHQDKRPRLSNLRESGAIEQDADVVVFIHRPDYYKTVKDGKAELIVAKQRNGPTGTAVVKWEPIYTRFVDDDLGSDEDF